MGACYACNGCGRCRAWMEEAKSKCPKCKEPIRPGQARCPKCGAMLPLPPGEPVTELDDKLLKSLEASKAEK